MPKFYAIAHTKDGEIKQEADSLSDARTFAKLLRSIKGCKRTSIVDSLGNKCGVRQKREGPSYPWGLLYKRQ